MSGKCRCPDRSSYEIPARLDPESAEWLRVLGGAGPRREAALARLHGMLLRIAQGEARRRGPRMLIADPELENLSLPGGGGRADGDHR
jgi:RNA polymerase sigma-70 factor (ECF subfamily)